MGITLVIGAWNYPYQLSLVPAISSIAAKHLTPVTLELGGGAVNDKVMHLSNSNLPFGGVGLSGTGSYHGKSGFDTFSHYKSILDKPFWLEPNIKYSPYSMKKLKIIKWLLK